MYNHELKSIFIHIPKTAGSSIRGRLNRTGFNKSGHVSNFRNRDTSVSVKHQPCKFLKNECLEDYFKFCFVRNPWDIVVSSYLWWNGIHKRWQKKHRGHPRKRKTAEKISQMTFSEFVKNYAVKLNEVYHHNLGQHYWFVNDDGKILVDFIGKFENLQEDFDIICDKIGIPRKKLPHRNKSKRKHYTEYYDDEIKQIVAEIYAKDIEYFGYEFGE